MANFSSLKQAIQNYIKENGNKEITGNLLQEILLSMVVTMGDNAINSLTTVVNELNTILHSVDAEPTKNSVNLVRSGGVWSGINREALRAFNAETFEARFNSTNNRVEFFNQSGDMLYWYDASAFVTTGLVEDVYIENDNLVFIIDTSAGEKTIEVPLEDVFNPNNYYTKTQIDDIVRTIRELYDGAEYRGFITPSSQAESKQGVKMVCFATEAGTYTNFLANYDTPIVIPVRGIWVFERGVDADDWTAYSLLEIDKVYAPAQASGMGRVVLQKNMVNGVNTLTQDMFYKGEVGSRVPNTNTIFVIEYDFTLGEDITVPANCVLEFDGGSITGAYTITGANTGIQAGLVKILGTDVTLAGTWNINKAIPQWFGLFPNINSQDCSFFLKMMCNLSINTYWSKGTWYFSPTCVYGVNNFKIIGEHKGVDSFGTVFRLLPNIGNANYILKLGGKPDFSYVDDYDAYVVRRFAIDGIYFREDKSDGITNHDISGEVYQYANLVLDNCASGYVNVGFYPYGPALLIKSCWEIIYDRIVVYWDTTRDEDNFGIPKVIFGVPNTEGSAGDDINASIIHDLMAEQINGPLLYAEKDANVRHFIINNITLENPLYKREGETTVSEEDYKKAMDDILMGNSEYSLRPIIDFSQVNKEHFYITVNNISLDSINTNSLLTTDGKYVVVPILHYSDRPHVIIDNIESTGGSIVPFALSTNKSANMGFVNVGLITTRNPYIGSTSVAPSLVLLSNDYSDNLRFNIADKSIIPNYYSGIKKVNFAACSEELQLNKLYTGYELKNIFKTNYNNYRQTNLINGGILKGAFSINRLLYTLYKNNTNVLFNFTKGVNQRIRIICYCQEELAASSFSLDVNKFVNNTQQWVATLSKTITPFNRNGYIIDFNVNRSNNDEFILMTTNNLPSNLLIESIIAEPVIE